VSGAISPDEVKKIIVDIGFKNISIKEKTNSKDIIRQWNIAEGVENMAFSAYIQAVK